jgi:hypothetical protein
MYKIPKIIHQIWIGPKTAPLKLMETWKNKNPDFEYIFWNESEMVNRNLNLECQEKINIINEINGKADIIRWEILYQYGGVFIDADSICLEPFDDYFMCKKAFASYENEEMRKGLVATGTMGFYPKHPLCRDILNWIKSDDSTELIKKYPAWFSVGPGILTRFLESGKYTDFSVFPSHVFLPVHFAATPYIGHKKVYAHQYWGTNYQLYDSNYFSQDSLFELPEELKTPEKWISLLLTTSDTLALDKMKDFLDSIKYQKGRFNIEIVWLDTSKNDYKEIKVLLDLFERNTRFTKITYHKFLPVGNGKIENYNEIGKILCNGSIVFSITHINKMMNTHFLQNHIDHWEKSENKDRIIYL